MIKRIAGGLVVAAIGYGAALLLDFEPRPLPYVVWAVVVWALIWLVLDIVETPVAHWRFALPTSSDRVDEATSDLRILSSHRSADHPSDALARRLVELARGRGGTVLATEIQHELAGRQRLTPAEIDRILTRIEDTRDRR